MNTEEDIKKLMKDLRRCTKKELLEVIEGTIRNSIQELEEQRLEYLAMAYQAMSTNNFLPKDIFFFDKVIQITKEEGGYNET